MTNKICSIDGCGRKFLARTWCKLHYHRWSNHGDPLGGGPRAYSTEEEAFAARTEWQGDCLIWTGSRLSDGYGNLRVLGKVTLAHRYAWAKTRGEVPNGLVIDHMCHNKACCNINHLRAITQQQNLENLAGPRSSGTSGHLNVTWVKRTRKWRTVIHTRGVGHSGGYFPEYELHVAAYAARRLRNNLLTYNDRDRGTSN